MFHEKAVNFTAILRTELSIKSNWTNQKLLPNRSDRALLDEQSIPLAPL